MRNGQSKGRNAQTLDPCVKEDERRHMSAFVQKYRGKTGKKKHKNTFFSMYMSFYNKKTLGIRTQVFFDYFHSFLSLTEAMALP